MPPQKTVTHIVMNIFKKPPKPSDALLQPGHEWKFSILRGWRQVPTAAEKARRKREKPMPNWDPGPGWKWERQQNGEWRRIIK